MCYNYGIKRAKTQNDNQALQNASKEQIRKTVICIKPKLIRNHKLRQVVN